MTPQDKITEMEDFLKENKEETIDTRDMANQLCGFKEGVKSCSEDEKAKVEKFLYWLDNGHQCICSNCIKNKIKEIFGEKSE